MTETDPLFPIFLLAWFLGVILITLYLERNN